MTSAPGRHARPARRGYRDDIQGLRALAVGLVVLDHTLGRPVGGFVGVDVFFVISGFLITGLLIREHTATGRISAVTFYRRRARRILPMSTLVLAATVAASAALYFAPRLAEIRTDAVWALLFCANWRFLAVGVDYFGSAGSPSPLQHYWSLAVEEQYYFVWPWLLALSLGVISRVARERRRLLGGLAVAAALVGFLGLSLYESGSAPMTAYFSTASRAWELLVGSALALVTPRLVRLPTGVRGILGWSGLAAVVVSAFAVRSDSAFPAPAGLLPVLGTAAVIAAGSGGAGPTLGPLTNPASRYLGSISYSLYLWHWPAIILLPVAIGSDRTWVRVLAAVLAVGLSVLSHHLVEEPVRRSRWLERRSAAPAATTRPRRSNRTPWLPIAAGCLLVVVGVGGAAAAGQRPADSIAAPATAAPPAEAGPAGDLATAVERATHATTWPATTTPPLEGVTADRAPQLTDPLCVNDWGTVHQHCTYGDAAGRRTAVLLGDSNAISWLPALEVGLGGAGWRIESYGKWGCPAEEVRVLSGERGRYDACDEHRAWAIGQLAALDPDLVILGSAQGYLPSLASGKVGAEADAEWSAGLVRTIRAVAPYTRQVVVLESPPYGKELPQCATRGSVPADCLSQVADIWYRTTDAERAGVATARAAGLPVTYVATESWFCTSAGVCPAVVDGLVVRGDTNHISATYAGHVEPALTAALQGVTGPSSGTAGS